jgi:phosphoglycerate dehydrogenase-like enzyme
VTKPRIIITEHLDDAACDWLSQVADVQRIRVDDSAFAEHIASAVGVVVRTYTQVDEGFLDGAPKLKVVGRAGVGLDNIDLVACSTRGIEVVHTPDANTQAVVEYIVSILGASLRPLYPLVEGVTALQWGELRTTAMAPRQLSQITLGILGFGRIGSRVAQVAAAIGMAVQYCDLCDIDRDVRRSECACRWPSDQQALARPA